MRRQICVLGLVAALLAMVAVPAAAAPRKEKPAREVREALRAASRFLEAYPERRADLLPPGITQEELDDEIVITYRSHADERKATRLNTFEQSLIDLGRSILATQDRDNLVRVYSEFVGMLFDGTFDTAASDYVYDPVRTRSIHAELRYLLWTMADVDGARHLMEEMGVK